METVKLIIDRKPVEVPKGTTILDAAKGMGIRIPTLCYMKLEDLHYENNPGACRICVVEIEGRRPENRNGTDPVQPSGRMSDLQ